MPWWRRGTNSLKEYNRAHDGKRYSWNKQGCPPFHYPRMPMWPENHIKYMTGSRGMGLKNRTNV